MTLRVNVQPPHWLTGRFSELDQNRSEAQEFFARWVEHDDRMRGHVLDVGCGGDLPEVTAIRALLSRCRQLDGVDPRRCVTDHPALMRRWCDPFEDADVPAETYDAVFTFWVVEHVRRAQPFLQKAHDVLRPGGVFYAFTPHALHPFALIVRLVQLVNLKEIWRRINRRHINAYPAYYRLNRLGSIMHAGRRAGFASADIHYLPCVQWDTYFPRPLRVLPHAYDRLIGGRFQRAGQLLAFRLEKAGIDDPPVAPDAR
ncbi:MAG: class I SAM-dependent methyltransferase [Planctomycetota bacterium]